MKYDISLVNELIKNRRSIFPVSYSDQIIEKEIVEQILENANWAPTHGMTQPWSFKVFTGEGLKRLATFQSEMYKELTLGEDFDQKKYEKLATKPQQCSHVISIGMKRGDNPKIPEIEEIEAVACAVQNMYLTATAYGIGAYWGSGGVTYKEEAKAFFGLGEEDKLLGFFFMGYPKTKWPQGFRKPISDKVIWEE